MAKQPLKVGFDLDGVLLYNPARIVRMPVAIFKRIFFRRKKLRFYFPKNPLEQLVWRMFHWSSLFVAPGFEEIRHLVEKGKIEAHLVTARYSFLESDLRRWLKRMDVDHVFKSIHFNQKDEQPHLYKERLVKDLDLDIFIEDNFDIVSHLTKKTKANVYWIYNIFDRLISHPYKFPHLKPAIERIKKNL